MRRGRRPAYKKIDYEFQQGGIFIGDTPGRAVPHNQRRACLCKDSNTYKKECCKQYLINQSIGQTKLPPFKKGAFSNGFSRGFDVGNITY